MLSRTGSICPESWLTRPMMKIIDNYGVSEHSMDEEESKDEVQTVEHGTPSLSCSDSSHRVQHHSHRPCIPSRRGFLQDKLCDDENTRHTRSTGSAITKRS